MSAGLLLWVTLKRSHWLASCDGENSAPRASRIECSRAPHQRVDRHASGTRPQRNMPSPGWRARRGGRSAGRAAALRYHRPHE
jgi:hypothetical protein